jgi:hypothetical protein
MKGLAQCTECDDVAEFDVPRATRNPAHRRTLQAYLEEVRITYTRRHRRTSECGSSRVTVVFTLAPRTLVEIRGDR